MDESSLPSSPIKSEDDFSTNTSESESSDIEAQDYFRQRDQALVSSKKNNCQYDYLDEEEQDQQIAELQQQKAKLKQEVNGLETLLSKLDQLTPLQNLQFIALCKGFAQQSTPLNRPMMQAFTQSFFKSKPKLFLQRNINKRHQSKLLDFQENRSLVNNR